MARPRVRISHGQICTAPTIERRDVAEEIAVLQGLLRQVHAAVVHRGVRDAYKRQSIAATGSCLERGTSGMLRCVRDGRAGPAT